MIERVIANSLKITERPSINDKNKIVKIDFNNICDLAYIKVQLKRQIKKTQGQNKTLELIASDGDKTILDIDVFLQDKNWFNEINEVLESFEKDMNSFNLHFTEIKIVYSYELGSFIMSNSYYFNSAEKSNLILNCNTAFLPKAIEKCIEFRNNNKDKYKIKCNNKYY